MRHISSTQWMSGLGSPMRIPNTSIPYSLPLLPNSSTSCLASIIQTPPNITQRLGAVKHDYIPIHNTKTCQPLMMVHRRFSHSSSNHNKSLRLTLIGAPGSGKGTQSTKIEQDFGLSTISTGLLLRRIADEASDIGRSVSTILKAGDLVGDEIMMNIIKREISSQNNGWLLDGYPRNPKQAAQLDELLQSIDQPLSLVFHLKVPEEVLLERINERWIHPASGRTYNMSFSPPKVAGKDDVTGEPLVKRQDDNDKVMKARLRTYHDATYPLLEYYHQKGILIPVESPTSIVGYVKIKQVLEDLVKHGVLKP